MLERIGAGYRELHQDLTLGRNSAWAQYRLATLDPGGAVDNGGVYFGIDTGDPARPRLLMGKRTKFLRQYFKFVRRGARRVGASTSDAAFDPVAFVHPDGTAVVVIKAEREGLVVVRNLPAASYGIKYTTQSAYDVDLPDIPVREGAAMSTGIPGPGVLTIYGRRPEAGAAAADGNREGPPPR
jgi:hypothetical protein